VQLDRAARAASRAFDDALAEVGGSRPTWLILISLKTRRVANQRELAALVGIRGATLTHHLNAMENAGLVTRRRDPDNRRVHVVEMTPDGEAAFHRLRGAATAFDRALRAGLSDRDISTLEGLLQRIYANVEASRDPDGRAKRR
jgi:MarR family transcriptional regulator, transcriptional regulator for hemolysin